MDFLENTLMVLRDLRYFLFFVVCTGILMFVFGLFMQIIFLSPKFIIYLEGFTNAIDVMFFVVATVFSSLTFTLLLYRTLVLRGSLRYENRLELLTSFVSVFVGACTCSGVLPLLAALSFLGLNVFVTRFFTEIRIVTMALLIISFYLTSKNLMKGCKIKS